MASPPKAKADIKLIILGSANVGKTCLLQRYLTGDFAATISSIGASLALKQWGDWNVALWDTAGEEKYASLSAFYCRGASVAILSFDITNEKSFKKLQEIFIPLLQDSIDSCLIVVVGTKSDLVEEVEDRRQVRRSRGMDLAVRQHEFQVERALKHTPDTFLKDIDGSKLYYETSAKTGKGVEKLFEDIQCMLLDNLDKGASGLKKKSQKKTVGKNGVVQLGDEVDGERPRDNKGCC